MNFRFISTKAHGFLDLASAALMPLVPRVLGFSTRVTRLHDSMAGITTGNIIATDYEMGVVKVLPMQAHLALDAASGAALLAAAAFMSKEDRATRVTVAGAGLLYLAAAFCTQPAPPRKRMPQYLLRGEMSAMSRYASERRPQAVAPAMPASGRMQF